MARYTFAARLARGKRVLDAGCGAGYGSAELARDARNRWWAWIVAAEAVEFARAHYRLPNLSFEQGVLHGAAAPRRRLRPGGGLRGDRAPGGLARISARSAARAGAQRPVHRLHAQQALLHRVARPAAAPIRFTCTNSISRSSAPSCAPSSRTFPCSWKITWRALTFQPHEAGHDRGSARGCGRARARRIAFLRGGVRAPPADRQSDVRLRSARRPTCCASASATSRLLEGELATKERMAGRRRSGTSPN